MTDFFGNVTQASEERLQRLCSLSVTIARKESRSIHKTTGCSRAFSLSNASNTRPIARFSAYSQINPCRSFQACPCPSNVCPPSLRRNVFQFYVFTTF